MHPENSGGKAKIHQRPVVKPANDDREPFLSRVFGRVAAVGVLAISLMFPGALSNVSEDVKFAEVEPAVSATIDFSQITDVMPAMLSPKVDTVVGVTPFTMDTPIMVAQPVQIQIPSVQDDLTGIYMAAADIAPETIVELSVENTAQYVRDVYVENGAQISDKMQSFFDKISKGLEIENLEYATVGAYDAARLMSNELGFDNAGLESRAIYTMIEQLDVAHPVTRWARNGAAMKLPSQALS